MKALKISPIFMQTFSSAGPEKEHYRRWQRHTLTQCLQIEKGCPCVEPLLAYIWQFELTISSGRSFLFLVAMKHCPLKHSQTYCAYVFGNKYSVFSLAQVTVKSPRHLFNKDTFSLFITSA